MIPPIFEKQTRARLLFTLLLIIAGFVPASAQTDTAFWFATPHVIGGERRDTPILVRMMAIYEQAEVKIYCPANPAFAPITATIGTGGVVSVNLTKFKEILETDPPNTILNRGLKIESTKPITAYFDESSERNPEIYALKGQNALGFSFFIPGQNKYANSTADGTRKAYNSFDIVATEDGTKVTIRPSKEIVGHAANQTFTITLNKGQTYSCQAIGQFAGNHLGGSTVVADKMVAVTLKDDFVGVSSCMDAGGDQLIPVTLFGKEYVSINGWFSENDRACVMAVENNTRVYRKGVLQPTILSAGQTLELTYATEPIYITSDKPVSVLHMSGVDCELSYAVLPPLGSCIGSKIVGMVRPGPERCYLILLVPNVPNVKNSFRFNNSASVITSSAFQTVPGTTEWLYARIELSTSVLPSNASVKIENTLGVKFHAGLLHGVSGKGASYGYFSNYATSPVATPPNDTVFCNGQVTGDLKFSSTVNNSSFEWINDNTAIGLPASGKGDIKSFVAKNETDHDVIANVEVVPTANDCVGPVRSFTIIVHPTPKLKIAGSPGAVCFPKTVDITDAAFTAGSTADLTYHYYSDAAGTSALSDPKAVAVGGTYYIRGESKPGCLTEIEPIPVTIYPKPVVKTNDPVGVCAPATIDLTAAAVTTGSSSNLTFHYYEDRKGAVLVATPTAVADSTTYFIAGISKEGCVSDTVPVKATIYKPVVVTTDPVATSVCETADATFETAATGSGTLAYQWETDKGTGTFTDIAGATSFKLSLTAVTNNMNGYKYRVRVTGTCGSIWSQPAILTVKPLPHLSGTSGLEVCSGEAFNYSPAFTVTGTSYSWKRLKITGITNAAAAKTNEGISETLENTTVNPITATYSFALEAAGCTRNDDLLVKVNPTPRLSSTLTPAAICDGETFKYEAKSLTTGVSFNWKRNDGATGAGNTISEVLVNSGTAPIVVEYEFTLTANGCSNTEIVKVTVNPTPRLSSALMPAAICNGAKFEYEAESATTGTSFSWQGGPVSGITNGNKISQVLTNTGTAPVSVKYVFTLKANTCVNTQEVAVTVNPTPKLSSTLIPAAICNGETFKYEAESLTSGVQFSWVSDAGTSGSGANISELLTNTSTAPVNVKYTFTLTANNCTNTQVVTVKVNPTPKLSSSLTPDAICNGATFNYEAKSLITGVQFSWVSDAGGSGTGSNISEVLNNTGTAPISVKYDFTLTANGCTNKQDVTVKVNPTPKLSTTLTPAAICDGATFSYEAESLTAGVQFSWISNTGTNGTGNKINEVLTNTGTAPITVKYTFTLKANDCINTQVVTVKVNPTPKLSTTLTPVAICNNATFNYEAESLTAGAQFSWVSDAGTSGSGNKISEVLTNTGTNPVNVKYTFTLKANDCVSTQNVVTVKVNPTPKLSTTLTPAAVCNNTTFTYEAESLTSGVQFTWVSDAGTSGGSNKINEILTNTGTAPISVKYTFTLTANGCTNTQTVTVIVNPKPKLSSTLTPAAICNGSTFNYEAESLTSGVQFSWVSDAGTSGSSSKISEVLANTGTDAINVKYTFTLKANDCVNAQEIVTVKVNPTPKLSTTLTPAAICNNTAFSYEAESVTSGVQFSWTSSAGSSGSSNKINEVLTNTGTDPISVKYAFTLTANGCVNTQDVSVVVNPTPKLSTALMPAALCNNVTFNYEAESLTSGVQFSWTSSIGTAGSGNKISEILTNTGASPVSVKYTFTLKANGCTNTQDVTVVVNPTPKLNSTPTPAAICNGAIFIYEAESLTSGVQFSWVSDAGTSGAGNKISEVLTNAGTDPVNVKYTFTLKANDCVNAQEVVTVKVNPTPKLSTTLTPAAICNNTAFSYEAESLTGGVQFSWVSSIGTNGSSNKITEVLANNGTAPVTVKYTFTLEANGCTNTQEVAVVVNPTPKLNSTLTPAAICNGATFNYEAESLTNGVQFSWISDAGTSGFGNKISEVLSNTGTDAINVKYTFTLKANDCVNAQEIVTVKVNPTPRLSTTLTPSAICNNTTFSYEAESLTNGVQFTWIGDAGTSGSGNKINEVLTNTGTDPVTVKYTFTLTANGCTNTQMVTVVVNPTPKLSSTLTPAAICNGATFDYEAESLTNGTQFSWVSDAGTSGAGNKISEILTNTGTAAIDVKYTFTLKANDCANARDVVTVKVNPTPKLSSTLTPSAICNKATFSYEAESLTSGVQFSWVSDAGTSGSGNKINETLTNAGTDPVTVKYTFTLTANGCTNMQTVAVVVNPTPRLSCNLTPAAICNGATFNYEAESLTSGVLFSWISDAGTSGSGNKISEVLTNTGTNPVNVKYTFTLKANDCVSTQDVVTVKVNPTPKLSTTLTPAAVCNNTTFTYEAESLTSGVQFTWVSDAGTSGSSNKINEILTNTGTAPISVKYTFTLTANGCTNTQTVTVMVNPTPKLSSTLMPAAICNGSTFNYEAESLTSGVQFSWVSDAGTSGGSNKISEVLANTGTDAINVKYTFTLKANDCVNAQEVVTVKVNPTPKLSTTLTPAAICNGTVFSYEAESLTAGVQFSWVSSAGTSGSGNKINEALANTGTDPVQVKYTFTLRANDCINTQEVIVVVNPTPKLSSILTPAAICDGATFNYEAESLTSGVQFSWVSDAGTSGNGNKISEVLTNSGTEPVNLKYTFTLKANDCINAQEVVTVKVNPTPKLSTTLAPAAICNKTTFNYEAESLTSGVQFSWTSSSGTSGNNNKVSEVLTNTGAAPVIVKYTFTLKANDCINTQEIAVVVNPTPKLSSTLTPAAICDGSTFSYEAESLTSGVQFSWVSDAGTSGTGNKISEALTNTGTALVSVKYTFILTANGCTNSEDVIVSVNPTPKLNSTLTPAAICNGATFNYEAESLTSGVQFSWVSDAGTSGTGHKISEILTNTGTDAINVKYTFTLKANDCINAQEVVTVKVNPTPKLSTTLTPVAICNKTTFNYEAESLTSGVQFSWTSSAGTSGSSNKISEVLTNAGTGPITVKYTFTLKANDCINTQEVAVVVNPTPKLSSTLMPAAICDGATFVYEAESLTSGVQFSWVSDAGTSGTGNKISEVLTNTGTDPVTVKYTFTLKANDCVNAQEVVTVKVNPTPKLSTTLVPAAICDNATFIYEAESLTTGVQFSWASSAGTSGNSNKISEVLTNTGTAPISVKYTFTLKANGCNNTQEVTVVVNPTPKLSSMLTPAAICNGATFNYEAESLTSGVQFSWISDAGTSGTGNKISEVLTNGGTDPINVKYTFTLKANDCVNAREVVTVKVNPTPKLSTTLTPSAICNKATFSYEAESLTSGVQFSWISDAGTSGSGNKINEVLTNTGTAPISVKYTFTLTANGCTNTQTVTVVVNPTPKLSSTLTPAAICNGSAFGYEAESLTSGVQFSWVSDAGTSGNGNKISEVLTNTGTDPVNVKYTFTLKANNCVSAQEIVAVKVNPTPKLSSALAPAAICNKATFTYEAESLTAGVQFTWTSSTGASGSGNKISEVLTNTGAAPVSVKYTFTLKANDCTNTQDVTVVVNPTPRLNSTLTPAAICNGATFNYEAESLTSGVQFSWISDAGTSGTGNKISEVLTNSGTDPVNVKYTFSLKANDCVSAQDVVTVKVNPTPKLSTTLTPSAICNKATFSYEAESLTSGVQFNWVSDVGTSGSGNKINEVLTNAGTDPVNVKYTFTLTANGCINTQTVTVVVNPTPKLSSTLTPAAICNGATFNYEAESLTSGVQFSWVSDMGTSGAGNKISELLTNNGTAAIDVKYTFTLKANNCVNAQDVVTLKVNPTPKLNATLTPAAICNKTTFNYEAESLTSGTQFSWTSSAGTSGNSNKVSEVLTNTGTAPVTVKYTFTLKANDCINTQEVTVVVNPTPKLSSTLTPAAICDGATFNYEAESLTNGVQFSWVSDAGTSGAGKKISEVLTNSGTEPVNVKYTFTLKANDCVNTQELVTVKVNPTPKLSTTLTPAAICNNATFNYEAESLTSGVQFSWTSSTGTSGSSNRISEVLTNAGTAPVTVKYTFVLKANGCSNTQDLTVVVNPTPKLSSTLTPAAICNGATFNYEAESLTSGVQFTWVSDAGTSGTGNKVTEVLTNTGTDPVNVKYTFTLKANDCVNAQELVTVKVNPTPKLSTTLTPAAICNSATFNYEAESLTSDVRFSWTSSSGTSGSGNKISEVLTNTGTAPVSVKYTFTLEANGCTNTQEVTVVVNPTPKLSSTLTPAAICNGTTFRYEAESLTNGVQFSWVSDAGTSGTGNKISEVLTNTGTGPVNVKYTFTLKANDCVNAQEVVTVKVNPTPKLSTTVTPAAICNGATFNYEAESLTTGVLFSWTSSIGTVGSGNKISEVLTNTGTDPIDVRYTFTLTANGCVNTQTVMVVVNPTPKLSSTLTPAAICDGATFSYEAKSLTNGVQFSWVSDAGTSGSSSRISEVLTNTGTAPIDVKYTFTLTANSCVNIGEVVTVKVNPTPKLSSTLTPAAICNGATFTYEAESLTTGVQFSWTSSTGASGSSNKISEVLTNAGTSPINVKYTFALKANDCINTQDIMVVVNPTPKLSSKLTPAAICNGATFSYEAESLTSGVQFTWVSDAGTTGTGNKISEVLTNNGTGSINVKYTFTLTANNCVNAQEVVTVKVNPTPKLSSTLMPAAICDNATFSYEAESLTSGVQFSWTSSVGTSGSSNKINEVLANIGTAPVSVKYTFTLEANGCTNTQEVTVVVNPTPKLSSTLTPAAICNGATFNYEAESLTSGVQFSWISDAGTSGTGNKISEVLTNTGTAPVNVKYTFSLTANNCVNAQEVVTVRVNPTPKLTTTLTPAAICNNTTFSYEAESLTNGVQFSWTSSNGTSGNSNKISEVLINTGTDPVNVKYTFTLKANGCSNAQEVMVIVNPTPKLNSTLTPAAICNNATFNYEAKSLTSGVQFSWVSDAGTSGSGAKINEVLFNPGTAPIVVKYTFTLKANDCINSQDIVSVVVNPTPKLSSTLTPAAICNKATFSYEAESQTMGTQFSWVSSIGTSGTGNKINEVLTNTGTSPVSVKYTFTLKANDCINMEEVTVVVNPTPKLSSTLTPGAICNNSTFSYEAESLTSGAQFSWVSDAGTSGSGAKINEVLTNSGTAAIDIKYIFTLKANGCVNAQEVVAVRVNPTPKLSSTLTPAAICNNTTFTYEAASLTTGVQYRWTSDAGSNGTGNKISEVLSNTGITPVSVKYTFTLTANNCTNTQDINVVVNPTPKLSSNLAPAAICDNTAFRYTATSDVDYVNFSWTRTLGNTSSISKNINEILVNNTAATIKYTYKFRLEANGCVNEQDVVVQVKPTPKMDQPADMDVCHNTTTLPVEFKGSAVTNTTYSWVNSVTTVGLAASGTGDIASFRAVNTTFSPVKTIVKVTPSAEGCAGETKLFTITVNPVPEVTMPADLTVCNNTATPQLVFKSDVAAANFAWENDNASIGLPASGSGNIRPFTALNGGAVPVVAHISVKPDAYGCIGQVKQFAITVNPSTIIVTQPRPNALCEGGNISFSVGATGTNLAYQWEVDKGGGFTPVTGGNSAVLTLNNVTSAMNGFRYRCVVTGDCISRVASDAASLTVYLLPFINTQPRSISMCEGRGTSFSVDAIGTALKYQWQLDDGSGAGFVDIKGETDFILNIPVMHLSMNGYRYRCVISGTCALNVVSAVANATVKAAPVISKQPVDQLACEGQNASFFVEATGAGLYYQWQLDKGNGFENIAGATNARLSLTNVSASMDKYRYRCNVSGTCTPFVISDMATLAVPKPVVMKPGDAAICNNLRSAEINITSSIATASYEWTNSDPSIGLAAAGKGNKIPSFDAVNTGTAPVEAEIKILSASEGCPGETVTFRITVNPTPVLAGTLNTEICSGNNFFYDPKSSTGNASFTWTRSGAGAVPVTGSGAISEVLVNSSKTAVPVDYTYTIEAAGCRNQQTVSVAVKPVPKVAVTGTPVLCEGEEISLLGSADLAGVSFSWKDDFGNLLGNDASYNIVKAKPADGRKYVLYGAKQGCESAPENYLVNVKRLPVAGITGPVSLCIGSDLVLKATSDMGADAYQWTGPASLNSRSAIVNINAVTENNAGVYELTITKEGCVSLPVTSAVEINKYPEVTIISSGPACDRASLVLSASASLPDASYVWNMAGVKTNGQQLSIPNVTGSQVIAEVAVSKKGCTTEKGITLDVKPTPAVTIQSVPDMCQNAGIILLQAGETTGLAGTGAFSGSSVSAAGAFDPSPSAGTYAVKYTYISTDGCAASAATVVKVNPAPIVNAGPDKTMYEGMGTYLEGSVTGNFREYTWVPLTNTTGTIDQVFRPLVTPAQNTTYKLSASNVYGCVAEDEVVVTVLKFRVPTAFSPNGDGYNDKWNIPGLNKFPNARVEIFNRWGTRLFLSKGYNEPWDGKYNGSLVPTGTYYYVISLNDGINAKPVGGWVEVMR